MFMRIGELADRAGVTTRALRYYEQQGLLGSDRRDNGYREYEPAAVTRVANIRLLLAAGLTSDDIRQVSACLSRDLDNEPACDAALALYEHRLGAVEERVEALTHLRSRLQAEVDRLRRSAPHPVENEAAVITSGRSAVQVGPGRGSPAIRRA